MRWFYVLVTLACTGQAGLCLAAAERPFAAFFGALAWVFGVLAAWSIVQASPPRSLRTVRWVLPNGVHLNARVATFGARDEG